MLFVSSRIVPNTILTNLLPNIKRDLTSYNLPSIGMKFLFKMVTMLWCNRNLIISLTVRDLSARYVGTFAGISWLIVQPLVLIMVFWVVFSLGFRAMWPAGTPFLVYFLPAFVVSCAPDVYELCGPG